MKKTLIKMVNQVIQMKTKEKEEEIKVRHTYAKGGWW